MMNSGRIAVSIAALMMATAAQGRVVPLSDHPAALSAARIAAENIGDGAEVEMRVESSAGGFRHDGYVAENKNGKITVTANRPRSLLYAAGETCRWAGLKPGGRLVREAAFKSRLLNYTGQKHSVAEWVAATGANMVHLRRNAHGAKVRECRDADVECWAFLYGCDPAKWDERRFEEYMAEHPEAKGTDPGRSWEKGVMCPSEKATREFFAQTIADLAQSDDFDGVVVTFWDDYGVNCHCKKCRRSGLADSYDRRSAAMVKWFESALKPLGKKLIVRTWSSGAPHFLGGEWVHAPGYASREDALATWDGTMKKSDPSTVFMTKVYNCDCQPNPPFSNLLGRAKECGRREFAEWQITGQTLGLNYLPYSVVDHTAWTMKKARELVGPEGGVCIYAGGYKRSDYEMMEDRVNSVNLWAWRQLAWDPDDDVERIWREWAEPRYGEDADAAIKAMKACEKATAAGFSPLGLGAPTESRWARNVERREDLFRYTNRHYLDEGKAALAPTEENIARIIKEKDDAIKSIDIEVKDEELAAKLRLLKNHLEIAKCVDGAMWKYRRIRYLKDMGRGDARLMQGIIDDFDTLRRTGYELSEVLNSPVDLMRDIHDRALEATERVLGPEWRMI